MLERGQTSEGPLIAQVGNGTTLKTVSLASVQPLSWIAVNRTVAEAEETYAVVVKDVGSSIVALPDTMLQLFETIGCRPGVA